MAAAVSVGYGKDEATVLLGIAAVDDGGVVTVWPADAAGSMVYRGTKLLATTKAYTLQSYSAGTKFWYVNTSTGTAFQIANAASEGTIINDMGVIAGPAGIGFNLTSSDVILNRCIVLASAPTYGFQCSTGGTVTLNNCMAIGCTFAGFYNVSAVTATYNFCLAYYCETGFYIITNGVITNCVSVLNETDFGGILPTETSDNNTSSDGTAPGANPLISVTQASCKFAWPMLPNSASLSGSPAACYVVDGQGSVLENTGVAVGGVTTDIDNRARADPPNRGPVEGFFSFGYGARILPFPSKYRVKPVFG